MKSTASFLSILTLTVLIVLPRDAVALIGAGGGEANHEEKGLLRVAAQMGQGTAFPFWKNVGQIERSTGIYLGNGYVITAAHVGMGNFRTNDGRIYEAIPGSAEYFRNRNGSLADILMYRITFHPSDPVAKLPAIPLATMPPQRGTPLLLMGGGAGSKSAGRYFDWSEDYRIRWGVNSIEEIYSAPMPTQHYESYGFATRFGRAAQQCQAAPGDSGGAAFHFNPSRGRWELAGVIVAVDSEFGRAAYGNQTYIADPALFRQQLAVAHEPPQELVAVRR